MQAFVRRLSESLYALAVTLWVGGLWAIGFMAAPALFASLKDKPAEGTGIYFGKDPQTLFVNVQHSGTGNDKTMVITKRHSKK